jgi:hypothetical protein
VPSAVLLIAFPKYNRSDVIRFTVSLKGLDLPDLNFSEFFISEFCN